MNELTQEQQDIVLNIVYVGIDFVNNTEPIGELLDIAMKTYDWAFQHFPNVDYIIETHIVDAIERENIEMGLDLTRVEKQRVFQIAFGIRNRLCM